MGSASLSIPRHPFDVSGPLPWARRLKTHLRLIMKIVFRLWHLSFRRWPLRSGSASRVTALRAEGGRREGGRREGGRSKERRQPRLHGDRPLDSPRQDPPPSRQIIRHFACLRVAPPSFTRFSTNTFLLLFIRSDFDLSFVTVGSLEPLFNY